VPLTDGALSTVPLTEGDAALSEAALTQAGGADLDAALASTTPYIIGVRHHAPSLAIAVPKLLDRFRPTVIALELPADLQEWIVWLGHDDLQAPVALSVTRLHEGESSLGFYPFADFSPELAAIRWGAANNVPVVAIDLPAGAVRAGASDDTDEDGGAEAAVSAQALTTMEVNDVDELWDRMVEARAVSADAEEVRFSGLRMGWLLRADDMAQSTVSAHDLARERHMRKSLRSLGADHQRVVAVVGAYHACALIESASASDDTAALDDTLPEPIRGSLVPYRYDLFDSRSGYPAGIRDPEWQQAIVACGGEAAAIDAFASEVIVSLASTMRADRHQASTSDAQEALRVARDLAVLRGFRAPARREVLEGIESAFTHGETLGRGRIVARSLEKILVGRRAGRVPAAAPRSGLATSFRSEMAALRFPSSIGDAPVDIRLEPWRSELDLARIVALRRLAILSVPYGTERSSGDADALTSRWTVAWDPATDALLENSAVYGSTLGSAATGVVRHELRRLGDEASMAQLIELCRGAALGCLPEVVVELLQEIEVVSTRTATFSQLLLVLAFVEHLGAGLVPGLSLGEASERGSLAQRCGDLRNTAFDLALPMVEAIAGSDELADAQALAMLVSRLNVEVAEEGPGAVSDVQLTSGRDRVLAAVDELQRAGSPLMQGAGAAAAVLLGRTGVSELGLLLSMWFAGATDLDGRRTFARRVQGTLTVGNVSLLCGASIDPVHAEVAAITDEAFLQRVASLREGFSVLSTADRRRLLDYVAERCGVSLDSMHADVLEMERDPLEAASWLSADLSAQQLVAALNLPLDDLLVAEHPTTQASSTSTPSREDEYLAKANGSISAVDRWRLVLGQQRRQLRGIAGRAGAALDELYGRGSGEGSESDLDAGSGGGTDESFPTARLWADELDDVFGGSVREEVLGRAAAAGRFDAALCLDPESIQPSVALLTQVLSLRGSLGPSQLAQLRRIVDRVVHELVRVLATSVRPALTGRVGNRVTRRPGGPLDLGRTIEENLRNVQATEDGSPTVVVDRLWFKQRQRKSLDWRVVFVVDVSGSMEASTIYSALMAAIIGGLPAVSSHFVAFSTEIVDLTGFVDDPLGLLLEVKVGGGTNIAKGLAYARSLMTVPKRTIVIVVSDFEEGGPVTNLLSEVRQLAMSGAQLLGLAALDDDGKPRFEKRVAQLVADAGMPVAALSPLELARWVGERIR
jgi:Family of unknown function (DUF5682)/VWA domain containing CoxE-like protein